MPPTKQPTVLFADEYSGDLGRTDYGKLAKVTPLISQKCGEGPGEYPSYPVERAGARKAGMDTIAYFWILMRYGGKVQAEQHDRNALDAAGLAVDLEEGRKGTHSSNAGAGKATVLKVMHEYLDRLHELRPQPVLIYGSSFIAGVGITWSELIGGRDWCYAWPPRYDGGGDIRTWTRAQILSYIRQGSYRTSIPAERIAAVQFTDGIFGPQPHTLSGLNRTEDISVLLVPPASILKEEDVALTKEQERDLEWVNRFRAGQARYRQGKPAPKKGTPEREGFDFSRLLYPRTAPK